MVGEALAGLSAIKTAFDIAKGLKDISDATARNAAVIELQEKILSAQAAQSALVDTVSQLEKEVARLKAWDAEKQRYELKEVGPGAFARVVKESMRGSEPVHWLCTTCYDRGKPTILQLSGSSSGYNHFKCFECQTQVNVPRPDPVLPVRTSHQSSWMTARRG
jgi:hypothetical protein